MKRYRLILKEDVSKGSLEFRQNMLDLFSKAINFKCDPDEFYDFIRYFKKIPGTKPVRYKPDRYCLKILSDIQYYDSIMYMATNRSLSVECSTYDLWIEKYNRYTYSGDKKLSIIEDSLGCLDAEIPNLDKVLTNLINMFRTRLSSEALKRIHLKDIIRISLEYLQKNYLKDKTIVTYPGLPKTYMHTYMIISIVNNQYLSKYVSFINNMENKVKLYVSNGYHRFDTEYMDYVGTQYVYTVKKVTGNSRYLSLLNLLEGK